MKYKTQAFHWKVKMKIKETEMGRIQQLLGRAVLGGGEQLFLQHQLCAWHPTYKKEKASVLGLRQVSGNRGNPNRDACG